MRKKKRSQRGERKRAQGSTRGGLPRAGQGRKQPRASSEGNLKSEAQLRPKKEKNKRLEVTDDQKRDSITEEAKEMDKEAKRSNGEHRRTTKIPASLQLSTPHERQK